ncbi:unnamed protein product [Microthlaspi erraticum]|uniref:Peptidase A2 domain-containing protein n=1 Tax=Microthlaspi erraticum TaxID=1685480 RepID=A0A6D2LD26_9BRAS|nr:unnamed protein product [Microthlaspi erraticum]
MDGVATGRGARGRVPSVATASVTYSVSVASEASVDVSVGLRAEAAPGGGGAPAALGGGGAPAACRDDLVVGLLTQLLAQFPPVVPQGAPVVPPMAEVKQRAAEVVQPQAAVIFICDSLVEVLNAIECVGTLLVGGFESHVLFDSGASNCFITPERAEKSGIRSSAGESAGMVKVAGGGFLSTLGRARGVEIEIAGQSMPADLVISPVELYDVILGMDWLSHYRVHLDCYRGRVVFERDAGRLVYQGVRPTSGSIVISAIQAEQLLERGCEAYLATISMSESGAGVVMGDIEVVQDFEDVFQSLKGLPPSRSDPFTIELEPGTAPYRRRLTGWRQLSWQS